MSEARIAERKPAVLELEPGTYFWCACGRSGRQPFCDGSHKGTEFTPRKVEIAVKGKVALCQCKHARDGGPFCDGSHKQLS